MIRSLSQPLEESVRLDIYDHIGPPGRQNPLAAELEALATPAGILISILRAFLAVWCRCTPRRGW